MMGSICVSWEWNSSIFSVLSSRIRASQRHAGCLAFTHSKLLQTRVTLCMSVLVLSKESLNRVFYYELSILYGLILIKLSFPFLEYSVIHGLSRRVSGNPDCGKWELFVALADSTAVSALKNHAGKDRIDFRGPLDCGFLGYSSVSACHLAGS